MTVHIEISIMTHKIQQLIVKNLIHSTIQVIFISMFSKLLYICNLLFYAICIRICKSQTFHEHDANILGKYV